MDKAGFSEKPQNFSDSSSDDIPAALRDTPDTPQKRRLQPLIIIGGLGGLVAFALIGSVWYFVAAAPQKTVNSELSTTNSSSPTNTQLTDSVNAKNSNENTVLGHFAYPEAAQSELKPITTDGRLKLRKGAAEKFQAMVTAARAAGVSLIPISGFRSVQEQQSLFFDIKAQRGQVAAERAAVSAPPGYSEHHTGYAVDIGDGATPATNLSPNFEKTKAFEWLQANAARFSFEMSFPKDNPQGVSYEPWHWRYVGDRTSLETFYKSKNIKPQTTP